MAYFHPQRAHMLDHGSRDDGVVALKHTNGQYDFGSGMPLPPRCGHDHAACGGGVYVKEEHGRPHPSKAVRHPRHASSNRSAFRNFSRSADMELLDYLRARKISPFFLNEIDQFLSAHSEVAFHRPEFVEKLNCATPLSAYRYFIRGYTKPARYIDGALPDISDIPLSFDAMPLVERQDPELSEFFAGYEYRYDILARIDTEVRAVAGALYTGQTVTMAARRLVVFAWYGNLVDAYKFYEYNFQTEWLAHRYLPEHIILTQVPKAPDYTEPVPRIVSYQGEDQEKHSHAGTRARMARAHDAGVDVIEVLLQDFSTLLARQGLKRGEIERMRSDALRNIDYQRQSNGGRDIVDMVMNRAQLTKPTDFGREITKKTGKRTKRINGLKHTLARLLAQEVTFHRDEPEWVREPIKRMRQRVERELVRDVTKLAFEAGLMSSRDRSQWCNFYVKKTQEQREKSGRKFDVLTELSLYL